MHLNGAFILNICTNDLPSLNLQGMYTQSAEQLWKKITEHVSDSEYSIKQTICGLDSFIKTFQISK